MFSITTPNEYDQRYLEISKCRPFIDQHHINLIRNIINKNDYNWNCFDDSFSVAGIEDTAPIYKHFKEKFTNHITKSTLNSINGLENSARVDIIQGCTQYLDNLHLLYDVQILENEYSYNWRIKQNVKIVTVNKLIPDVPLIISVPFAYTGCQPDDLDTLLDTCFNLNIPVHIDAAWLTAARNVNLNFNHPAIASIAASMSKGYGTSGWNRIGLRWTKSDREDSITLLNDHLQTVAYPVVIGNYILDNTEPDHLWNKHGNNHFKICRDFELQPSDTIHMTRQGSSVIGISPLLRYLENV
jgi:hypothetical protein